MHPTIPRPELFAYKAGPRTDRYVVYRSYRVYRANRSSPNRMTDKSELQALLEEALWSLEEGKDAENARTCVTLACAALGQSVDSSKKKKIRKKRKHPRQKPIQPPYVVDLVIQGRLPGCLTDTSFRAAVLPLFEDRIQGKVTYIGFVKMRNGTFCYNFRGMCPIHLRTHTDVGPWQLKQHPKSEWCGFKCWKQDSYSKLFSNEILSTV